MDGNTYVRLFNFSLRWKEAVDALVDNVILVVVWASLYHLGQRFKACSIDVFWSL
jgi:hypothetical protein